MSAPDPAARDTRIDLLRGIAVLLVCTDHIAASHIRYFTPLGRCFFDLTEAFIFLSGCACGLAYTRRLRRSGFLDCQRDAIRRGWRIYVAYILASLLLLAGGWWWEPLRGFHPTSLDEGTILDLLRLRSGPAELTILTLYLLFAPAIPAIVWCRARWPGRTLLVSGTFYLVAQVGVFPRFMALDPFAWQFLFVCGAACTTPPGRRSQIPRGPIAILLALLVLQVSVSLLLVVSRDEVPLIEKRQLEPLRLIAFGAAVVLGGAILPRSGWGGAGWLAPLRKAGRHSLPLFCCGAFLSRVGDWVLRSVSSGWIFEVGVVVSVWIALTIIAIVTERARERKRDRYRRFAALESWARPLPMG